MGYLLHSEGKPISLYIQKNAEASAKLFGPVGSDWFCPVADYALKMKSIS